MSIQDFTDSTAKITSKDGTLLHAVLTSMTTKPEIDWESVVRKTSYKNVSVASTRYSQVMKKLSGLAGTPAMAEDNPRMTNTTTTIGSGTNKTTAKVKKTRAPRGSRKKALAEYKVKVEKDDEHDDDEKLELKLEDDGYGRGNDLDIFNAVYNSGPVAYSDAYDTHDTRQFEDASMQDNTYEEIDFQNQGYGYPYLG